MKANIFIGIVIDPEPIQFPDPENIIAAWKIIQLYHGSIINIHGFPIFVPVELVLERLEEDIDTTLLFADYPQLTNEDVKACLWYAKELVKGEEVYPTLYQPTV